MLGHDLRNPLSSIVAAAAVLRQPGLGLPSIERQHAVIERQAGVMARLLDDMLDVSRITHGCIELRKERLELGALLERTAENCRSSMEERGHRFTVARDAAPLWVEADPVRLEQVLSNLLTNALKYTPPGGSVAFAADRDGDEAVISVRDTGMGISADLLPRIFELFTQAERTLARSEGGLGLGLTMVKRLMQMHGGSVEARSDGPGHGSEFLVRLPVDGTPEQRRCR